MTELNTQEVIPQQAYKLRHDVSHLIGDANRDAWIVKFPGWRESYSGFYAPVPIELVGNESKIIRAQGADGLYYVQRFIIPERVAFQISKETTETSDYPYCQPQWPIMSKRMLDTLLSVKDFPHQAIPVTMIDCDITHKPELGRNEMSGEEIHGFFAVQLLDQLDITDPENSTYKPSPVPGAEREVEKVVLKVPDGGLPPIFREKQVRTRFCVSPEGREALEAAGIRGISFLNIN